LRGRGQGGLKGQINQIKMFDDLVYNFVILNKGNNVHICIQSHISRQGFPASGTDKEIYLIRIVSFLYGLVFGYQLTQVSQFESSKIASNWLQYLNKLPTRGKKS